MLRFRLFCMPRTPSRRRISLFYALSKSSHTPSMLRFRNEIASPSSAGIVFNTRAVFLVCAERYAVIPSEHLLFSLSSRARAKPDEGSSDVTKNGNRVDSSAKAFGMTARSAFGMTEKGVCGMTLPPQAAWVLKTIPVLFSYLWNGGLFFIDASHRICYVLSERFFIFA